MACDCEGCSCVTPDYQVWHGRKRFEDGADSPIAFINIVTPLLDYVGLRLIGKREPSDTGSTADVTAESSHQRTAGDVFQIYNLGARLAGVNYLGQVYGGTEGAESAFLDSSTAGNHVSLTARDDMQIAIQGRLGKTLVPDMNGNLHAYAGKHGDVTMTSKYARTAGWLLEVNNPTDSSGAQTNSKFVVDHNGGISQPGAVPLAQFGRADQETYLTVHGQFFDGPNVGTMRWSTNPLGWYYTDGTSWISMRQPP